MAVLLSGNAGVNVEVDEGRNLYTVPVTAPGYPAAGGWYSVAGKTGTAAIVASLATDTNLAMLRFSTGSTRKAYIYRTEVYFGVVTAGAAAGVPGVLGLQRFATATPSGGSTRTPARISAAKGSATDMTDVRDNNAALTVTNVTFSDEFAWAMIPNGSTITADVPWIENFTAPIELAAGDGLTFRTRQAGPATATWFFSYTVFWFER